MVGGLTRRVDELLREETSSNRKAHLIDERGYLSLSVLSPRPRQQHIEEGFRWWMKLMAVVDKAPLFPLEEFADRLTQFIRFFDGLPAYHELTRKVDASLSKRSGAFTAAEKCRDRAIALYDAGKMLGTINQLHQSKVNWFAAETMEYSLLSMLLISECYRRLGLTFAAKYYALAVASIALHSHSQDPDLKKFIPRALEKAAESEYQQGSWCGLLGLTDVALMNHHFFAEEASDISAHGYLHRVVLYTINAKVIAERVAPRLVPLVDNAVDAWGLNELVDDLTPLRRETWPVGDVSELWSNIEEGLSGRPFNDLGETRESAWSEVGVTWRASWASDYATTPVAEGFVSFFQILLADLVGVDLCLMKTEVTLVISISGEAEMPEPKVSPSGTGRAWEVTFTESSAEGEAGHEGLQQSFMAAAMYILLDLSLLEQKKFEQAAKKLFHGRVKSKLLVAQPYEALYREFIREDDFAVEVRREYERPEAPGPFQVKEYDELRWFDGPGPGYSKAAARKWVNNRYKHLIPPVAGTLERLKEDGDFLRAVERLRMDGWLDWHILSAVHGITLNYRTARLHPDARHDPAKLQESFNDLMRRPERPDDPVAPPTLFTEDKMREQLRWNMLPTIKLRGLVCHQRNPDMYAIDHFLRHRYNYWTDDVEHEPLF